MKAPLALLASLLLSSCSRAPPPLPDPAEPVSAAPTPSAPADPPVLVEELPVTGDRAIYPVRGSRDHRRKAVLLAGWCGNPAWYLNAFLYPAARYGDFVGLQGDIDCGGAATRWSGNLASLVRRAETAFAHAGVGELEDVTVVGYSQGAERAEWLAAYDPVRFTRFVLVAGPIPPSATHFARAHAVVLMAG